jgi:hypothetical protein
MAKGKTGILGTGAFRLPRLKPEDLAWDDIESRVGIKFGAGSRREVFRCYLAYHARLSFEQDRAPPTAVEELRWAITKSAQTLIDVHEHFRNPNGARPSEADEALYSALTFSSTQSDFDLTTILRKLDPLCRDLLNGLREQSFDPAITRVKPEVAALSAFFVEARTGVEPTAARSSPGYLMEPNAFEYRRWGVPLGPKSPLTAVFASAVLERPVTISQVEHALDISPNPL